MNTFESLLLFLEGTMERPTAFGWFHLLFWGITILCTVLLCVYAKNMSLSGERSLLFCYALLCLVMETYKQLVFSFEYDGTAVAWHYQWYAFPFQFCSTPMYVALLAAFWREGNLRNAFKTYLATFGAFAGILVMFNPDSCFVEEIGINLQTMIHHTGQIILGLYLLITHKTKGVYRSILGAMGVFLACVAIAEVMNVLFPLSGIDQTFNMFFISPYFQSPLPVYSSLYPGIPFALYLFLYILPFCAAAWMLYVLRYPHLLSCKRTIIQKNNDIV